MPDTCLFCRIIAGEIPAKVVYETDTVLAFRDIGPKAPVHVLVIPMPTTPTSPRWRRPIRASRARCSPLPLRWQAGRAARPGFRVIFNTGGHGGQEVFHVHAHVVGGGPLGPMLRPMKAYERPSGWPRRRAASRPSAAAVHRGDRPLWTFSVGRRPDPAGPRFRIGSITKTFTAVLVLQCRDDGLLELDDPLGKHLDVTAHGDLTIARLLSHNAGLQREPYGDVWDTMVIPDERGLLAELDRAERVLPSGRRMHYSNLAYALLGRLVGDKRGGTWAQALAERVLAPLGLSATTVEPTSRAVTGYLVDAYSDHARREPVLECRGLGPAAQLWSTAADMATWAAFLADPAAVDPGGSVLYGHGVGDALAAHGVRRDQVVGGFGLGLILMPQGGDRIVHIGHDGAMPGFLAAAYGRRGGDGLPAGLGAAVLGSSGTGVEVLQLPHTLLGAVVKEDPAEIAPWQPGEPAPSPLRSVLGRWWGEGFEFVFSWRDGKLRARAADDPPGRPPAVFGPVEGRPDVLRTESGPGGRGTAAADPRRGRHRRTDALGDVPVHPRPGVVRRQGGQRAVTSGGSILRIGVVGRMPRRGWAVCAACRVVRAG